MTKKEKNFFLFHLVREKIGYPKGKRQEKKGEKKDNEQKREKRVKENEGKKICSF